MLGKGPNTMDSSGPTYKYSQMHSITRTAFIRTTVAVNLTGFRIVMAVPSVICTARILFTKTQTDTIAFS